jgi:CBS domain-containing protein
MGSTSAASTGAPPGAHSRSTATTAPTAPTAPNVAVADVMSTRVYTCAMADTLDRAALIMSEHGCGAVPVVDAQGHAIAMVTDRDICMAALACHKLLTQIPVMTAASRRMYAVRTVDTLDCAHELMCKHRVRRLPVVDAYGHLIGIVSIADLVRAARSCGEPGLGDA